MGFSKVMDKAKLLFAGTIIYSLLIADFVLWSGFSLGFFIIICITEIGIFLFFPKPESRRTIMSSSFLALCIIAFGTTFLLYSDIILSVINFFVLTALLLIQLLLYSGAAASDWDEPEFFTELLLSSLVRPLKFLGSIRSTAKSFNKEALIGDGGIAVESSGKKTAKKILIGFLITLPVLLVVTGLLSSADQIFGRYTEKLFDILLNIKIKEYLFTIFFGTALFPLLFSFLYSYYIKYRDSRIFPDAQLKARSLAAIDPVIAATSIFCLDIIYGLFTWIQFGSLFGAFAKLLPADVTYAEYTREGFFQLCAVALINIIVAIASVMFVSRKGTAGIVVKIMSVLLVFFTFVLLISAGYRMKMYVDVFALTKLRVLVSLFMGLIALLLLYTLIKEFTGSFRFFKTAFITAVLVLLLTNYLNTDVLIARYNINQYISNPGLSTAESAGAENTGEYMVPDRSPGDIRFDSDYLIYSLSYDAVPELIKFAEANDNVLSENIKASLVSVYDSGLENYRKDNWKRYNVSKERARTAIEGLIRRNLQD